VDFVEARKLSEIGGEFVGFGLGGVDQKTA